MIEGNDALLASGQQNYLGATTPEFNEWLRSIAKKDGQVLQVPDDYIVDEMLNQKPGTSTINFGEQRLVLSVEAYKERNNKLAQYITIQNTEYVLTEMGRNLTIKELIELSEEKAKLDQELFYMRQSPSDVSHQADLAHLSKEKVNTVLVLNADKIVNSLDTAVIRAVMGSERVSLWRPLLKIPVVKGILAKLESIALKNLARETISRTPTSRQSRTGIDFYFGGSSASRLLIAQSRWTNQTV